ncbi:hypothetical protein MJO28_013137 [Puccinia striiformis f. sp. tritici]|uniref:Uncharacterized protein n=1 Tax=Puccinia striiformis f. sp. tritici TaxID=168172 RepID=A0ACC0DZA9_9BASI|nr:uncharacterized protein Pst134EA_031545 [Puccinia striiformis f. sp. tritici]XP_047800742.1 hypothetical protein Pst134EA_024405 [Puccinia striiformis f. sp. tritici]KAH9442768.1 hypothetical protein Pst134EA_031545 [Puccinia striiformis f. sp. tritici]KAH9453534.1 hypothetical protein Pst134EA_024405 [Puccinia striiformis f. sp. tritici]KAI7940852.1 hypothetical protein MJO28_013137 [Puccinia striiformis f. sp. tritici]
MASYKGSITIVLLLGISVIAQVLTPTFPSPRVSSHMLEYGIEENWLFCFLIIKFIKARFPIAILLIPLLIPCLSSRNPVPTWKKSVAKISKLLLQQSEDQQSCSPVQVDSDEDGIDCKCRSNAGTLVAKSNLTVAELSLSNAGEGPGAALALLPSTSDPLLAKNQQ